jgi:hypothetical protein
VAAEGAAIADSEVEETGAFTEETSGRRLKRRTKEPVYRRSEEIPHNPQHSRVYPQSLHGIARTGKRPIWL